MNGIKLFFRFSLNRLDSINLPGYTHPFALRKNTTDIAIFKQIFFNKCYTLDYPFEPSFIIDAGANIGLATIFYKHKFPNAHIVTIEPEENNYSLLIKNTKFYSNIHYHNAALSNQLQELYVNDIGLGASGFIVSSKKSDRKIKTITIPEILNQFNIERIDILKIDIEGGELELFESEYEKWLPLTRCLIIETHDQMRKGTSKAVLNAITKYDFSLSLHGENMVFLNNNLN